MNDKIIALIVVGGLVVLMALIWGITFLVYHLIDKRAERKWYEALAKNSYLRELVDTEKRLWEVYKKKSDIADGYKKQIDSLLCSLVYLPSYEVEWRTNQAEIYKQSYFEARAEADKWYNMYITAHNTLEKYCEEHNLRRMS